MKKDTFLYKFLISIILIVLLFEFFLSNNVSFASDPWVEIINGITNVAGGLVSVVLWIPKLTTVGISYFSALLLTKSLTNSSGVNKNYLPSLGAGDAFTIMTPIEIFFGKYQLLDVNIFDFNKGGDIGKTIRTETAKWFYLMRNYAAAILLVVLVYVGIRMAISTVAEDKAKYKKMLSDWAVSMVLIFVLQYIAMFTIQCNQAIVTALANAAKGANFTDALKDIEVKAAFGVGLSSMMAFLCYVMILFQTLFFFIAYLNRFLKVAFLIIISPLISLTYALDKMGDGKAQALEAWLKEFVYTILIQPFHCIMYLAFANTAAKLLTETDNFKNFKDIFENAVNYNQIAVGVIAVLCFKFIGDGEKVVRKIFNFQDDNSSTGMMAGAIMAMSAAKMAKSVGTKTRTAVNTTGKTYNRLSEAFAKDADKFKGTKTGDMFAKINEKNMKFKGKLDAGKDLLAKNPINQAKNKFNGALDSSKLGDKFHKLTGGSLSQYVSSKSAGAIAGMVAGAAMYSTGDSSFMQAYGTGAAAAAGMSDFASSSMNNSAHNAGEMGSAAIKEGAEAAEREAYSAMTEAIESGAFGEENEDTNSVKSTSKASNAGYVAMQQKGEAKAKEEQGVIDNANQKVDEAQAAFDAIKAQVDAGKDDSLQSKYKQEELEKEMEAKEKALNDAKEAQRQAVETKANNDAIREEALSKYATSLGTQDGSYASSIAKDMRNEDGKRGTAGDLEAKKNEILALIQEIMRQNASKTDSSTDNNIDAQEVEDVGQKLFANIDRGVLMGTGFSAKDREAFMQNHNLTQDADGPNTTGYKLQTAMMQYEASKRLANMRGAMDLYTDSEKGLAPGKRDAYFKKTGFGNYIGDESGTDVSSSGADTN